MAEHVLHARLVRPIQGQLLFNGATVLLLEQREYGQANIRLRRRERSEASNFSVEQVVRALRDLGYKEQILAGLYDNEEDE